MDSLKQMSSKTIEDQKVKDTSRWQNITRLQNEQDSNEHKINDYIFHII